MEYYKVTWLIDDDELANFLSKKTLKLNHFAMHIFTFSTIEQALYMMYEVVKERVLDFPDFIFLDINMPGLDGWYFLDSYAELPEKYKEKCKLYMLSSSIDKADMVRTEQHKDACGFISKPLSGADLERIKLDKP